jgi:hypothetical protein
LHQWYVPKICDQSCLLSGRLVWTAARLCPFLDSWSVLALALGVDGYAAVLRPAGSPFMPLRRPRQAPELRTGMVWSHTVDRQPLHKSRPMVYSAQRHKGGVGGHKQPRRTAAELSTPSTCSPVQRLRLSRKPGKLSPAKIRSTRFAAVQASQPP